MSSPFSKQSGAEFIPPGLDSVPVETGAEARADNPQPLSPEAVTIAALQRRLAAAETELEVAKRKLNVAEAEKEELHTAYGELDEAYGILLEDYLARSAILRFVTWELNHDKLTNLPTEEALKAKLATDIEAHPDVDFGIIAIDLGFIKDINDIFGHEMGDKVIKFVGAQLARTETSGDRLSDFFARRSKAGDEFVGAVDARPFTSLRSYKAIPDQYTPRTPRTPHEVMKYQVLRIRALGPAVLEQFPELRTMERQFYVGVAAILYDPSVDYDTNFRAVDLALIAQKHKDRITYGNGLGRGVYRNAPSSSVQAGQQPGLLLPRRPRLTVSPPLRKSPDNPSR